MKLEQLAFMGYGEVGKIFASGLKGSVLGVSAWDLHFDPTHSAPSTRYVEMAHAAKTCVQACTSLTALCESADCIISAVTPSNTLAVARAAAQHICAGTVFLDLNSASPNTKQQAAELIGAAGGHYVEAGIMTSVPPYGIGVPMLLGGAQAVDLADILRGWGMDAKAVFTMIGVASAIKMCRSVMIKGLEALIIESYATARHYGVEDHMIPTLTETLPSIDWQQTGAYFVLPRGPTWETQR